MPADTLCADHCSVQTPSLMLLWRLRGHWGLAAAVNISHRKPHPVGKASLTSGSAQAWKGVRAACGGIVPDVWGRWCPGANTARYLPSWASGNEGRAGSGNRPPHPIPLQVLRRCELTCATDCGQKPSPSAAC